VSNNEVHCTEPVVRVIVPASQGLHFDWSNVAYERSGHGLQSVEETDPIVSNIQPGGHFWQVLPLR
jgi:hypothetical protein